MIQGTLHPDFWSVAKALERASGRRGSGAAACVYHRGEQVADIWIGERGRDQIWQPETMAMSFSTTKGVVSTAIHILAERGLLDYDEPVATYWPEFAQAGKADIPVRQVLCHEAGLHGVRNMVDHAHRLLDWEYMVDALARSEPAFEPGTANAYHGLTYGHLAGEIVRRISGQSIGAFVRKEIAEPLGLDGFYIGTPESELARVAELGKPPVLREGQFAGVVRSIFGLAKWLPLPFEPEAIGDALVPEGIAQVLGSRDMLAAEIPAANGVFTARALARMYALISAGGTLDGVKLLSPDTIRIASEIQNRRIDRVVPFTMRWRLGYHLVGSTRGILPHAFGHFGYGGSGAWADPSRDLSVAFVTNGAGGTPFGDMRLLRLNAAAVRCADRR